MSEHDWSKIRNALEGTKKKPWDVADLPMDDISWEVTEDNTGLVPCELCDTWVDKKRCPIEGVCDECI